jgi:hypothetical protein
MKFLVSIYFFLVSIYFFKSIHLINEIPSYYKITMEYCILEHIRSRVHNHSRGGGDFEETPMI